GESVGEVADVLTPTTGRGMQVVVEGGSEGRDRKTIAVALDDIRVNADGEQLLTVSTREQLAAAPQVAPNGRGIADLIGANVVGIDGEDVGEVDDVLLSTAGGRSARAVLQVGGVAGIGEKRIALPLEQLKIDRVGRDEPAVSVAMN